MLTADREVGEALRPHLVGLIDITAVEDHRRAHEFLDPGEIRLAELLPSAITANASAPFSAS
jgi:hypothetical protein